MRGTKMKANYGNLRDFLRCGVDTQALTFEQLERITEAPISPDYVNRKTFKWSTSRFFIAARAAGFELDVVDYANRYIVFKRTVPALAVLTPAPAVVAPAPVVPAPAGVIHPLSLRPIANELRLYHGLTLNLRTGLVDLTCANSAIIEPIIPMGLRSTATRRILAKRYPPNALNLFNRIKARNGGSFPYRTPDDVREVVRQIDKDNGTNDEKYHDSQAIDLITSFIVDSANDFEHRIDGRPGLAQALVDEIRGLIDAAGFIDHRGKDYRPRSLPSKVCKYFSEYEYGSIPNAFYIDDAVVRECLRHYMRLFFNIRLTKETIDSSTYTQLFDWLSRLNTLDPGLSKSELDHLLWFPHKKK